MADGFPVQVQTAYLNSSNVSTSLIPRDDTIPQNTEGTEILTVSITPTSSTNILKVRASIYGSSGASSGGFTIAIFRDSTADAIAAAGFSISADDENTVTAGADVVAGSTSETTFKVRFGTTSAGNASRWNGSGGRYWGDIPKSYIEVTEVKAS